MRPFSFVCLMAGVLLGCGLIVQSSSASGRKLLVLAPVSSGDTKYLSVMVDGIGQTIEDAHQVAVEKAQQVVIEFLRSQDPPIEWTPSLNYVQNHLTKNSADEANEIVELGKTYRRKLKVEVDGRTYREMLNFDRHERMEQRHSLLLKVLGCFVALFIAIAGYIRLDELTKGYLTNWLRILGISALIVACVVVWYFL